MGLIREFEHSGNILFRYRGQIPAIFFLLASPVIILTNYSWWNPGYELWILTFSILLSLAGIFIRAYTIGTTPAGTSGRNTDKQVAEQLNTTGIYSIVRHPLYLGNYLMWAGLLIFAANLWFFLLISLVFWIYYERIMFAEEGFIRNKYGESFTSWSLHVPAFIPKCKGFIKPMVPFSWVSVMRREYSGWLAQALGFAFIDILRRWNRLDMIEVNTLSVYVLASFLILTLVLRSLKHYTHFLSEAGRS